MSITEQIKALPENGSFVHREYSHQTQWDDVEVATYAQLIALAASHERLLKVGRDLLRYDRIDDATDEYSALTAAIEEAEKI